MQQEIKQKILSSQELWAKEILQLQFRRNPELRQRYTEEMTQKCLQDVQYHLTFLAQAIAENSLSLYRDYIRWAKVLLQGLHIPIEEFTQNLDYQKEVISKYFPEKEAKRIVKQFLEEGQKELLPTVVETLKNQFLEGAPKARMYLEILLPGNRKGAQEYILGLIKEGVDVKTIYLEVFQPALKELGNLWQTSIITVAQEHLFTASTQIVMAQLYPLIFQTERKNRIFLGACVGGELHEIGIRMVSDFFEMEGWDTYYLGANLPQKALIQEAKEKKPNVIGLSATMVFHVPFIQQTILALHSEPETKDIPIIVGGYPFLVDPELWKQIGANGFGMDANQAIASAKQLIGDL